MSDEGKKTENLDRRQFLLRAGAAVGGALVATAGLSACGADDDVGGRTRTRAAGARAAPGGTSC